DDKLQPFLSFILSHTNSTNYLLSHPCLLPSLLPQSFSFFFFFFNDTAPTEIYTLSLHDALPICPCELEFHGAPFALLPRIHCGADRKSTRLNSSHVSISYAVFCLKKKKDVFIGLEVNITKY